MSARIRITAGRLGGRYLEVPTGIRPTAGRVRESLMSIWASRLPGMRVLDLFAGSGAVGIEAVSRGAAQVFLVENDPAVLKVLAKNCLLLDPKEYEVLSLEVTAGLKAGPSSLAGAFDLVFADPPYAFAEYEGLLSGAGALLSTDAEVVIEHGADRGLPKEQGRLVMFDSRRYGDSALSFYRLVDSDQG